MNTRRKIVGLLALVGGMISLFLFLSFYYVNKSKSERNDLSRFVYNAGAIFRASNESEYIEHTFKVFNYRKAPVKVIRKNCNCGCTKSDIDKELIKPGSFSYLNMSIKIPSNYSNKKMSCNIEYDDGTQEDYTVYFTSYPNLRWENDVIDLGTASREGGQINHDTYIDIFSKKQG